MLEQLRSVNWERRLLQHCKVPSVAVVSCNNYSRETKASGTITATDCSAYSDIGTVADRSGGKMAASSSAVRYRNVAHQGVTNVLADILSQNPNPFSLAETLELPRPGTNLLHSIELKIDNSVFKDIKKLGKLQDTDPRLGA